jgi:hypothetical protein
MQPPSAALSRPPNLVDDYQSLPSYADFPDGEAQRRPHNASSIARIISTSARVVVSTVRMSPDPSTPVSRCAATAARFAKAPAPHRAPARLATGPQGNRVVHGGGVRPDASHPGGRRGPGPALAGPLGPLLDPPALPPLPRERYALAPQ